MDADFLHCCQRNVINVSTFFFKELVQHHMYSLSCRRVLWEICPYDASAPPCSHGCVMYMAGFKHCQLILGRGSLHSSSSWAGKYSGCNGGNQASMDLFWTVNIPIVFLGHRRGSYWGMSPSTLVSNEWRHPGPVDACWAQWKLLLLLKESCCFSIQMHDMSRFFHLRIPIMQHVIRYYRTMNRQKRFCCKITVLNWLSERRGNKWVLGMNMCRVWLVSRQANLWNQICHSPLYMGPANLSSIKWIGITRLELILEAKHTSWTFKTIS